MKDPFVQFYITEDEILVMADGQRVVKFEVLEKKLDALIEFLEKHFPEETARIKKARELKTRLDVMGSDKGEISFEIPQPGNETE